MISHLPSSRLNIFIILSPKHDAILPSSRTKSEFIYERFPFKVNIFVNFERFAGSLLFSSNKDDSEKYFDGFTMMKLFL